MTANDQLLVAPVTNRACMGPTHVDEIASELGQYRTDLPNSTCANYGKCKGETHSACACDKQLVLAEYTRIHGMEWHSNMWTWHKAGSIQQPAEVPCSMEQLQHNNTELSRINHKMHLSAA